MLLLWGGERETARTQAHPPASPPAEREILSLSLSFPFLHLRKNTCHAAKIEEGKKPKKMRTSEIQKLVVKPPSFCSGGVESMGEWWAGRGGRRNVGRGGVKGRFFFAKKKRQLGMRQPPLPVCPTKWAR